MELFKKGCESQTYTDLLAIKFRYEQETKTLLTTKKSAKYSSKDPRCEDLVYSRIQYQCKAGEERKSAVSTNKMNCPVGVTLSVREGKLCVINSMLQHENHTQDYMTFMKYPENLRIKPSEIKFATELLTKGYDKKTIRSKLTARRGGVPLPQKFWSQIHKERRKDSLNGNIKEDLDQQECLEDSQMFTNDIHATYPTVQVKMESNTSDDSGDDDDPLSNMFEKCFSDDSVSRNDSKKKMDFDNWFKDLIPGEKLSYSEWLWQLEFNFPSLDKLNFIKYGIILGMSIMNRYYCDGSLRIDGNGIKEAEGQRKRKYSQNNSMKNSRVQSIAEEEREDEENFDDEVNVEVADFTSDVGLAENDVQNVASTMTESSEILTNSNVHASTEPTEPTMTDIKEHIQSISQTNQQINCKMCDEIFATHSQLYNHMRTMHMSHIGLNCPICNKRFQYERNLNEHITLAHVDLGNVTKYTVAEGKVICEICGAAFDKIASLRSHSRYAHSIEKFYCKYCNRKLSSKKSLREHIQFQHELTFVTRTCEDCQRIFKYKSSYRLHMRKQHGIHFG